MRALLTDHDEGTGRDGIPPVPELSPELAERLAPLLAEFYRELASDPDLAAAIATAATSPAPAPVRQKKPRHLSAHDSCSAADAELVIDGEGKWCPKCQQVGLFGERFDYLTVAAVMARCRWRAQLDLVCAPEAAQPVV